MLRLADGPHPPFEVESGLSATILAIRERNQTSQRYLVSEWSKVWASATSRKTPRKSCKWSGFVRNLRDGRVEVFAMATPQQHAELRTMLERGPRFSSVSAVQEESANPDPQYEADSLSIPAFERYEYEGMARRGDVRMNDLKKLIREVPTTRSRGFFLRSDHAAEGQAWLSHVD